MYKNTNRADALNRALQSRTTSRDCSSGGQEELPECTTRSLRSNAACFASDATVTGASGADGSTGTRSNSASGAARCVRSSTRMSLWARKDTGGSSALCLMNSDRCKG